MKTEIATDDRFTIGYDEDGATIQTDIFGDEVPASEGASFSDNEGREWTVEDGRWVEA